MTKDETLHRAESAQVILADPNLKDAFTDIEQAYVEALLDCKKDDDLGRFRLSEGMRVLRLVRRHLESHVEAGMLAVRDIEELRRGRTGLW